MVPKDFMEQVAQFGYVLHPDWDKKPDGTNAATFGGFYGRWGEVPVYAYQVGHQQGGAYRFCIVADRRTAAWIDLVPHYKGWRLEYYSRWADWFHGDSPSYHSCTPQQKLVVQWGVV